MMGPCRAFVGRFEGSVSGRRCWRRIAAVLVGCSPSGASSPVASGDIGERGAERPPRPSAPDRDTLPVRPCRAPATRSTCRRSPRAAAIKAYAAFLSRVNDDRATVDGLDRDLSNASSAADLDAVRTAAVAILDFVEVERDWLLGHPPADCYADAHASAVAMLEAYGGAADRFVDWSTTGGGLNGLPALGRAAEAADAATDGLDDVRIRPRRDDMPELTGDARPARPARDQPADRGRSRRVARGPR